MKLYKMVDIDQLESITEKGILPLSKLENQEWSNNNRANNSTEVVYLYKPHQKGDAFPHTYGLALLEVEVSEAVVNKMAENDEYNGKYTEYVVAEVKPEQIKKIYLPSSLKERLMSMVEGLNITWVDVDIKFIPVKAKMYFGQPVIEVEDQKELSNIFWSTVNFSTKDFNYFRGTYEMLDENSPLVNPPSVSYPVDAENNVKYKI